MGLAWLHINGWVDPIGFGRPFGAKPGPPERLHRGGPLNAADWRGSAPGALSEIKRPAPHREREGTRVAASSSGGADRECDKPAKHPRCLCLCERCVSVEQDLGHRCTRHRACFSDSRRGPIRVQRDAGALGPPAQEAIVNWVGRRGWLAARSGEAGGWPVLALHPWANRGWSARWRRCASTGSGHRRRSLAHG